MKRYSVLCSVLLALVVLGGQSVHALQVDNAASHIRFISVKKGSIAEISGFSRFSGQLSDAGDFTLSIDLSSVDTAIAIRDQRMRDELFEVADFPLATVSGRVDPAVIAKLKAGQSALVSTEATLSLHGVEQAVTAELLVDRLADGALRVSTVDPILLSMQELGLADGVKKLQQLAGLDSINLVVPVYFSLQLH